MVLIHSFYQIQICTVSSCNINVLRANLLAYKSKSKKVNHFNPIKEGLRSKHASHGQVKTAVMKWPRE